MENEDHVFVGAVDFEDFFGGDVADATVVDGTTEEAAGLPSDAAAVGDSFAAAAPALAEDVVPYDPNQRTIDCSHLAESAANDELADANERLLQRYGGRVKYDAVNVNWSFFTLLTVPDADRFTAPESVPDDQRVEVDLATLPKMSAADVKKLVTVTLPDSQLQVLLDAEQGKESPRKVAVEAILAEIRRRGPAVCGHCHSELPSYHAWLRDHAESPVACRPVAAALGVGSGSDVSFVVGRDGTEAEMLTWVWGYLTEEVGSYYFARNWRTLTIRSVKNCVPIGSTPFPCDGFHQSLPVSDLLAAMGLAADPLAGHAAVLYAANELNYRALDKMVMRQLEAERAMLLAERAS